MSRCMGCGEIVSKNEKTITHFDLGLYHDSCWDDFKKSYGKIDFYNPLGYCPHCEEMVYKGDEISEHKGKVYHDYCQL